MCHTHGHCCILPRAPSTVLWDLLRQNRRKQRAKLHQQHFFFFIFFYFAVVAISMLVASWWDGSCACALSWTCMLLKSDVPNPKGFSSRKSSAAPEEAVPDG